MPIRTLTGPLLALVLLGACPIPGDGELAEERRALPDFERLQVFDGFQVDLEIDPGSAPEITLRGERNLLPRYQAEPSGEGQLSLSFAANRELRPSIAPAAELRAPALRGLYIEDDAALTLTGELAHLHLHAADQADVALQGGAASIQIDHRSDGQIDAGQFIIAGDAEILVDGGGRLLLCVHGELRGRVDRGELRLTCAPTSVRLYVGPSGVFRPL